MDREIVYAFIDSQNLNLGTRSLGWVIDFKKFRIYLKDKYKIEKAFLFLGYIKENKKLYEYLKSLDYILIFKPAVKYKTGGKIKIKGNIIENPNEGYTLSLNSLSFLTILDAKVKKAFSSLVEHIILDIALMNFLLPFSPLEVLLLSF